MVMNQFIHDVWTNWWSWFLAVWHAATEVIRRNYPPIWPVLMGSQVRSMRTVCSSLVFAVWASHGELSQQFRQKVPVHFDEWVQLTWLTLRLHFAPTPIGPDQWGPDMTFRIFDNARRHFLPHPIIFAHFSCSTCAVASEPEWASAKSLMYNSIKQFT